MSIPYFNDWLANNGPIISAEREMNTTPKTSTCLHGNYNVKQNRVINKDKVNIVF